MNRPIDILFKKIIATKNTVFFRTGFKLHALKSAKEDCVICFLNGYGRSLSINIPATAYQETVKRITKVFIYMVFMKWEDDYDTYDI